MLQRLASATVAVAGLSQGALAQGTLIWSDEFNGTSLSSNWEPQIGDGTEYGIPGWGNNESQYYTDRPQNVFVQNGNLHIVALREDYQGHDYTSARIRTFGSQAFKYGRLEGRMKIPAGAGIWPAFWMLPEDFVYGGWAASGEIDIMESVNQADFIYGTTHHGGEWPNNTSDGNTYADGTDYSQDFHVYAIEWEPDEIRWYVDDIHYHTVTSDTWYSDASSDPRAPFNQDFHFLLNVAVGGNFPGPPNGSTPFPLELVVDYVRVYELDATTQSPFLGAPHAVPGLIEAEDYDNGGPSVAYNDSDTGNNGGEYRTDDVDIQVSSEDGYNVGWIRDNEWIEYTIDVAQAAQYNLDVRVASAAGGGSFLVQVDGRNRTGTITVPPTGGWQDWVTVSASANLVAGENVMRFVNLGGEYNLNWFRFSPQTPFVDWNADGVVGVDDLLAFLAEWFDLDLAADITGDGIVSVADLLEFLACWFPASAGDPCP